MRNMSFPLRKRNKTNENFFLFYFSLVIICKCLNISTISDHVPYSMIYGSFIVVWGIAALFRLKKKKETPFSVKIMVALMIYYIIWGLNNINNIDQQDAYGNLIRSVLFTFFIIICVYWIKKFDCLDRFIKVVYLVFAVYLLICFVISIPQIDLFKTLSLFWSADNRIRYRLYFGFQFPNIAAEMAATTLILSKKVMFRKNSGKLGKTFLNTLMIAVIILNNSRGSLIAWLLFEVLYYYLKNKGNKSVKRTWRWLFLAGTVIIGYIVYLVVVKHMTLLHILAGTNRQAALYENMRLLANSGRWWIGVGRLTGGFFSSKTIFYGAQTGYLEVFYFEVFITTGIIGSIYMGVLIFSYIRGLIVCTRKDLVGDYGKWMFCIIIYMLFVSLFEVYFFSYVYESSMVLNIILLTYIDTRDKIEKASVKEDKELYVATTR